MTGGALAGQLLGAVRGQWRVMLAVLPGLVLTTLHSTALDLPKADVIDALDSDHYRIQWITGAYILGSAVGMAMTGFLGGRLGLRRTYLLAILLFAVAGGSGAFVSAVFWMTPLRLVQGFGNGLAISAGMVMIWRAFPVHKELAMAVYGMAVYLPAVAGAPLGGFLTAALTWRLIFLINLPLGLLIALVAWLVLPPDRPAAAKPGSFDWLGVGLLAAFVVTLSVVLDLGQYWGWLSSPYFVPWFVGLLVAMAAFVGWGVWGRAPLVSLRPLGVRHFGLGLAIKVLFSINLYVLVGLVSGYTIGLRGYQWRQGGLVLLPALGTMLLALVVGTWFGTDGNRKARMFVGLAVMAAATWCFAWVDVYTAKGMQAVLMAVWGAGAGLVYGPALLTTFEGLSNEQTLRTAGVFNVMRSIPTFLVAGTLATVLTQRTDAHFDWLRLDVQTNRPVVSRTLRAAESHFLQRGSDAAGKQAHATLGKWVHANARAFAFQDVFRMLALAPTLGMLLVFAVRLPARRPTAADSAGGG